MGFFIPYTILGATFLFIWIRQHVNSGGDVLLSDIILFPVVAIVWPLFFAVFAYAEWADVVVVKGRKK